MRVLPLSSCYGLCLKPFKGMWVIQNRGYGKEILLRMSER